MRVNEKVTQVAVTRFSVRLDGSSVLRDRGAEWLFSDFRMQRRLALFSNLTLPSIVHSTVRPDHYIVVVDAALPRVYLEMLSSVLKDYDWIKIHVWNPADDFLQLKWILELVNVRSPYVLTTTIDDDDALEIESNERMLDLVSLQLRGRWGSGAWIWFGSKNAWEWDLDLSQSDHGFIKPFSGGTNYWQGVGTSLLVPSKPNSPTSYAWTHEWIELVFSPFWLWKKKGFKKVFRHRASLVRRLVLDRKFKDLGSLFFRGWLVDVGARHSSEVDMLISNSQTNLVSIRMDLGKNVRRGDSILAQLTRFGVSEAGLKEMCRVMLEFPVKNHENSE